MNKFYLAAALFVVSSLFVTSSFAQANFKPAVVVTNDGDTLNGRIDHQGWIRNPKIVVLRQDGATEAVWLSPADTKSFRCQGELYVSTIMEIDYSPRETKDLTFSPKPVFKTDTVFLRMLFSGIANLYVLTDENFKQHYFIRKDSSGIHERIYFRYLKEVQKKVSIRENQRYKGQLTYFFSDCPSLKNEILNLEYKEEKLVSLFKKYNLCLGGEEAAVTYKKEKGIAKINLGFVAGATLTTIKFVSDLPELYYLTQTSYKNSVKPAVGVSVNIIFPQNQGKWALFSEMAYNAFSFLEVYELDKGKD